MKSLIWLPLLFGFSLAHAQLETAFVGPDTLGIKHDFYLPILYFEPNTTILTNANQEDLGYIAFMLYLNPQLTLRLRADGRYKRFENKQRRLNRKRVNHIARILRKEYDLPRNRVIKLPNRPWLFRSAREPKGHDLVHQRVICEVLWDR